MTESWFEVTGSLFREGNQRNDSGSHSDASISHGAAHAFRREKNKAPVQTLRVFGLSPSAKYKITNHDGGAPKVMTGKDLMESGLPVEIKTQPGSTVIFYKRH